uniref:Putative ovule protein n=1 Tax=Solanum chacoense TaxID=4108 RepID=A0A0V0GMC2_SOLCH
MSIVVARTIAHPMSIVVARTIAHSMRSTVVARTIAHPMRSTVVARTVAHSMPHAMAHHWPTWVATMLMAMASAVAHHFRFGFITLFFLVVRLFVSRARVRSWFLVSITIVIELFAFFFVALH